MSMMEIEKVMEAASDTKKVKRAPAHNWLDEEVEKLLKLLKGDDDVPGYFSRMKKKKLERNRAMAEIAEILCREGVEVTGSQADNKWKSLTNKFKSVEDHNSQTGNETMPPAPFHDEISEIIGHRAAVRPVAVAGSGIPVQAAATHPTVSGTAELPLKRSTDVSASDTPEIPLKVSRTSSGFTSSADFFCLEWKPDGSSGEEADEPEVLGKASATADPADAAKTDPVGAAHTDAAGATKTSRTAKKRARRSTSRSSEVMKWASAFEERQEKQEKVQIDTAKQQHADKMALLGRLVTAYEKKSQ